MDSYRMRILFLTCFSVTLFGDLMFRRSSAFLQCVLWLLLLMFLLLVFYPADFISIDCGSPSNYTDSLGIFWASDTGYIPVGQNGAVNTASANLGGDQSQISLSLSTIRYFPEVRAKYCYVLPETLGDTVYLIRATFLGGDFTSSQTQNTSFRLTINNYNWTQVIISDSYSPLVKEATYTAKSGPLSFCLVRGVETPFISSLELRALPSGFYETTAYTKLAFTTVFRWNCGTSPTSASVRYILSYNIS